MDWQDWKGKASSGAERHVLEGRGTAGLEWKGQDWIGRERNGRSG